MWQYFPEKGVRRLYVGLALIFMAFAVFPQSIASALTADEMKMRTLCKRAIQGSVPRWDEINFLSDVKKAKKLGLSERACARKSGRFTERELRSASNSRDPVAFDGRKFKEINNAANSEQDRRIERLNANIKGLQSRLKAQAVLIEKLTNISDVRLRENSQKNSNMGENLRALEQKVLDQSGQLSAIKREYEKSPNSIKTVKEINSQNDTILNNIGKWQDVIPRLERRLERLEDRKGDFKGTTENNNRGEFSEDPSTKKSSSSFNSSNSIMWLIPVLLLLAAFGIVIVVLVRRNNETRRQLEENLQRAGRRKREEVLDETEKVKV